MSLPESPLPDYDHDAIFTRVSAGSQNILITGHAVSERVFDLVIERCIEQNPWPTILFVGLTDAVCDLGHRRFIDLVQPRGLKCVLCTDYEQSSGWDWDGLLISLTPYSLDMITRRREVRERVFTKVQLLCICDLYMVSDARLGASLEAFIARFFFAAPDARIVATSLPLRNSELAAAWLSASNYEWIAPSKSKVSLLRCQVIRVPFKEGNYFKFENFLNSKLPDLIAKYSNDKPTLIYCSTRKSAELAAAFLSKALTLKSRSANQLPSFTDPRLNDLVIKGTAYHYSGMPFEDRRAIECLFMQGKLPALCTTSLSVSNLRLPCQLIVVKGAKKYSDNGYVDYTADEIERLSLGDNVTCIVLSSEDSMVGRETSSLQMNSRLLGHLDEYLLIEIAQDLINQRDSVLRWLQKTFLAFQVKDLGNMMESSLRRMERLGLVSFNGTQFQASPIVSPASRYGLGLDCLRAISKMPSLESQEAILRQLCMMIPKEGCRIYQGDKGLLGRLARSGGLRYPFLEKQISESWQKAFITIQVILGKKDDLKTNFQFAKSSKIIMRQAKQIIPCMVSYMIQARDQHPVALRAAIELAGAIRGECWHEGAGVLRQLDGIGAGYEGALAKAALGTIKALRDADPSTIEFILKRNPPFGVQLKENISKMPILSLELHEELCEPEDRLKVIIRGSCRGATLERVVYFMAILCSNTGAINLCAFAEIKQAVEITEEVVISCWSNHVNLTVSLLAMSHAGLNVQKTISPNVSRKRIDMSPQEVDIMNESGTSTIPTQSNFPNSLNAPKMSLTPLAEPGAEPGSYCTHRCKDKSQCKHLCCKGTVKRRRPSRRSDGSTPAGSDYCENDHKYVACEGTSSVEAFVTYIGTFQDADN